MKAIRCINEAEKRRIKQLAKENVAEWLTKNEGALTRRVMKVMCIALNEEFGFGAERLSKLIKRINATTKEWNENPVFWANVDRRLEQIGIPFEKENYDELEW